jgi:hypothetical protein
MRLHLLALAAPLAIPLLAQPCPPLPVGDHDGPVAAPVNHRVLYEDPDIRVIEVSVAPHSQEQFHTHLRPSVFLMLQDVHYKLYLDNGAVKEPPLASHPRAFNFRPEQSHRVENLDDVRQYALRIELKHPGCGPVPPPYAPADALTVAPTLYKLAFETDDVRVSEITLPPHTHEPLHQDVLPVLVYADLPADLRTTPDGASQILLPGRMTLLPPAPVPHATENLSDTPYHAFRIELKHALPAS